MDGYLARTEKAGDDSSGNAIVGGNLGGNLGIVALRRSSGGCRDGEAPARGSSRVGEFESEGSRT